MFTVAWLRAAVERIAATWIEATIALLAATEWATLDLSTLGAIAWATLPAIFTAAKELLVAALDRRPAGVPWWRDTLERTVATYGVAFLTLLLAGWSDKIDLGVFEAAAWAAVPAGLAVLKAAAAAFVGERGTAALLPKPKLPAS